MPKKPFDVSIHYAIFVIIFYQMTRFIVCLVKLNLQFKIPIIHVSLYAFPELIKTRLTDNYKKYII